MIITLFSTVLLHSGDSVDTVIISRFDNALGWRVNNTEGIGHQDGNRYFMVSDDSGSALLTTQLSNLELVETDDAG